MQVCQSPDKQLIFLCVAPCFDKFKPVPGLLTNHTGHYTEVLWEQSRVYRGSSEENLQVNRYLSVDISVRSNYDCHIVGKPRLPAQPNMPHIDPIHLLVFFHVTQMKKQRSSALNLFSTQVGHILPRVNCVMESSASCRNLFLCICIRQLETCVCQCVCCNEECVT